MGKSKTDKRSGQKKRGNGVDKSDHPYAWQKPQIPGEQTYTERESDISSQDKLYSLPFTYVFDYEWRAIAKRRDELGLEGLSYYNDPGQQETKSAYDVGDDVPHLGLKGIALSGGGIRSAAFCIGVTQAMDAVLVGDEDDRENAKSLYQHMDYVSSVSGGGYAGAALLNAQKMERNGQGKVSAAKFAFPSRLERNESSMLRHIRDHSNYLFPEGGFAEKRRLLASYLRGVAANIPVVVIILALMLMITTLANDSLKDLNDPWLDLSRLAENGANGVLFSLLSPIFKPNSGFFAFTILLAIVVPVLFLTWSLRRSLSARPEFETSTLGTGWAAFSILVLLCMFAIELQPRMISGLHGSYCDGLSRDYVSASSEEKVTLADAHESGFCTDVDRSENNSIQKFVILNWEKEAQPEKEAKKTVSQRIVELIQQITVYIAAFTGFFAALRGILGSGEAHQNQSQGILGVFANYSSMISQLVAGLLLPLAIWITYLYLAFWSIPGDLTKGSVMAFAHTPAWYSSVIISARDWISPFIGDATWLPSFLSFLRPGLVAGVVFGIVLIVFFGLALLLRPNKNSPHNLYRDSLAKAFIKQPKNGQTGSDHNGDHRIKLSHTRQNWQTPIHLFNAALNVQGSDNVNGRGRNASFFTFSDAYCGSVETGYVATVDLESAERGKFTLSSAMAISAAAASSAMGSMTMKPLAATFALLNVRLGYWLPNPRVIADCFQKAKEKIAKENEKSETQNEVDFGSLYIVNRFFNNSFVVFIKELFGFMEEKHQLVYLSDGGHIENLGVYELLKRRCKFIVVVDAEADPQMTFSSFSAVQRYARIDLGTLIKVSTNKIKEATLAAKADWHPPVAKIAAARASGTPIEPPSWEELRQRPHASIGTIHYPVDKHGNTQTGIMLYIKLSVTGDENDYVQEYARKYRKFPHETTGDQFFSEEQFEAYRALGFHAAFKSLLGAQGVQHWDDIVSLSDTFYGTPEAVSRFKDMFPNIFKR